jgi:hypothetical protein
LIEPKNPYYDERYLASTNSALSSPLRSCRGASHLKIVQLDIEGFRGIRKGTVRLDDFSVLIGANNCGKTTVIEALALLLGRDQLIRSLTEHDFFGSDPQPADRIRIIATITGLEPNEPSHHPDWFRMGRGVEKWLDPLTGELHPEKRAKSDKISCQIALCARFDRASLEVETVRYFFDHDGQGDPFDDDVAITTLPASLIRELGFFLVPASRTWDRMISFGSELFRRTVAYVGGKPAEAVLEERNRLRNPATPLEQDDKLKGLVDSVNKDLKRLFGRDAALKLRITSTDSEGVLQSVIPHFTELNGPILPSRRHGTGLISLQTLVLLMRFGRLRKASGENFIMAIEEPELHVPPAPQRKLLHLIQQMATQTVVTTHSPTVAAVPDPHQILLLVNNGGELSAKPLVSAPLDRAVTNVRRALFLVDRIATVSAIMHPAIIIPEGKTDASWLRLLARVADLTERDGEQDCAVFTHEVGIIPTKDARVKDTHADLVGVHPEVTCLVDGDATGHLYIAELTAAPRPCARVVNWPRGWAMEQVVTWICSADPSVLADPELAALGVPTNIAELVAFLQHANRKSDEVVHTRVADAIAFNTDCSVRARHLLSVLAAIATGRDVPAGAATRRAHTNGKTIVWTFNDAFPGI